MTFDGILQDVRYGFRTWRRSPAFALTAFATIALSIAALVTLSTLAQAFFFRRLPVGRPDALVAIGATRDRPGFVAPLSYPDYVTFRDSTRTIGLLAAVYPTAPLFTAANGRAHEINGAVVSANFFATLGLRPALGRFFHDDEDAAPGRDHVAVLGHHLWRDWFDASPTAVGATVRINGVDFTIVGVAPASFVGLGASPIEIYIPTMMLGVGYRFCSDALAVDCTILDMIGRLRPGATLADAAAEFPTIVPDAWRHAPKGENSGVAVAPVRGIRGSDSDAAAMQLLVGVAVVLLLVCGANLAGLLGAQSSARQGEIGVRLSLGASARRVVRQLMTESMLLAIGGGIASIALSRAFIMSLTAAFYAVDDEGHPRAYDFSLSPAAIVVALAAALAMGCVFSLIPAIKAVRRGPDGRAAARWSASRWSSGSWLLAAQAAVAVALVAIAGLLAVSAARAVSGSNFESSHVALMRLRPRLMRHTPARAQRFMRDVVTQLATTPGVESVSMVGIGAVLDGGRARVGLPAWPVEQRVTARYNEIGPRYFDTLRTPMATGREFDDGDAQNTPRVAIVNETLARALVPDRPALGATIVVGERAFQIVGVVTDVRVRGRTQPTEPFLYTSFWQNPAQIDARLCVRVAGDPAAMLPALARTITRVDPDVPIAETITLPIQLAGWNRQVRLSATVIGYAAGLAVLLTAIGLYGTLSFAVSRRTKEIGLRMALGAMPRRVLALVVREGLTVVVIGAAAGVGLALVSSRLVVHLLYGTPDTDWIFYAAGPALVSIVGLFASLMPARRAAAVEPLVALHHE